MLKKKISIILSIVSVFNLSMILPLSASADNTVTVTLSPYTSAEYNTTDNSVCKRTDYLIAKYNYNNVIRRSGLAAYCWNLEDFKGAESAITDMKITIYPYNYLQHTSIVYAGFVVNDMKMPEMTGDTSEYNDTWKTYLGASLFKSSEIISMTISNKEELSTLQTVASMEVTQTANSTKLLPTLKTAVGNTGYYSIFVTDQSAQAMKYPIHGSEYEPKLTITYDKDEFNILKATHNHDEIKEYVDFEKVLTLENADVEKIKKTIADTKKLLNDVSDCSEKTDILSDFEKITENLSEKDRLSEFYVISEQESISSDYGYTFTFEPQTAQSIKVGGFESADKFIGKTTVVLVDSKVFIFNNSKVKIKNVSTSGLKTTDIKTGNDSYPLSAQKFTKSLGLDNLESIEKIQKIVDKKDADSKDVKDLCDEYENFKSKYTYFPSTAILKGVIGDQYSAYETVYNDFKELKRIYAYIEAAEESLAVEDYSKAEQEASKCTNEVLLKRLADLKAIVTNTVPYIRMIDFDGDVTIGSTLTVRPDICYPNNSKGEIVYKWVVDGINVSNSESLYLSSGYEGKTISCEVCASNSYGVFGPSLKSIDIVIGDDYRGVASKGWGIALANYIAEGASSFDDTVKHWAREIIEIMSENGIVNGVSNRVFAPDKNITRAEFTAIVMRVLDLDLIKYNNNFSDVNEKDWYADYISTAYYYEFIKGSGSNFNPDKNITREEMATILVRVYEHFNDQFEVNDELNYSDAESISSWALESVKKANALKIMIGSNNNMFNPKSYATRAQATVAVYNFINSQN